MLGKKGDVSRFNSACPTREKTDTGEAKNDGSCWMRIVLDTVGKTSWTIDRQGRAVYPEGFEELAKSLGVPHTLRAAMSAVS
jgi:type III restriction enzyme